MPRSARIHSPGSVFHVVSRFAADARWLEQPGARPTYLSFLGRALSRSDAEVLAYCLMSTHVHWVVVQGQQSLSRLTKSVHLAFAMWIQRVRMAGRRARGPVFAERPRALLVDRDAYLLELIRYVHNNPVRAGVSSRAIGCGWSSHRAYVGQAVAPAWLRTGYALGRFSGQLPNARSAFDAFVDEGRHQLRRSDFAPLASSRQARATRRILGDGHRISDGILGSDAFVAQVRSDTERVEAALSSRGSERRPGARGRPSVRQVIDACLTYQNLDPIDLELQPRSDSCREAKRLAVWMWVHDYEGQQIDVARALSMATSAVSRHYSHAVQHAGHYDEQACAARVLLETSESCRRPTHEQTPATAKALPVRYLVDVDEA